MKQININDVMVDNFMPYTAYLILDRALPLIDGFKPSQRRVLYSMYNKGYTPNKPYVKSNSIGGDVMKIHPHGSTYGTLVRMSEGHEAFNVPFIDSKGNFGKLYSRDSREASDRYTEARLNKIAMELFNGINKNAVPMKPTYDDSGLEPEVLPVPFPVILTNGISGMAVGMATEIPPFNFHEVLSYTKARLTDSNAKVLDHIKAPDFPTDNDIVYSEDEMKQILETGRGGFKIRAKYTIKDNTVHFHNVPYTTRYEAVLDQLADLSKEGKLKEVVDVDDLYGLNSTGIRVTARKNTNMPMLVEKLFKLTRLEDNFSLNLNIVIDNTPMVLGIPQVVDEWIKFRKETILRMTKHQIHENKITLNRLQGLETILNHLDDVIQLVRTTKGSQVIQTLMDKYDLNEEQAEYIESLQLKQLAQDRIEERLKEIEVLKKRIQGLTALLSNEKMLVSIIVKELDKLNKEYSFPRRTGFVDKEMVQAKTQKLQAKEDKIEEYNNRVFITKDLYLKNIPLTSLRGNYTNRIKEDDEIIFDKEMTNLGEVIVYTNKHNIYKKRLHEIEDTKPSELGEYIPSLFDYSKGEEPLFAIAVSKEFTDNVLLGFSNGTVAVIESKAYYTKQNRQLLRNGYAKGKELIFVTSDIPTHLLGKTSDGLSVVRELETFSPKSSRSANGNKFLTLNEDCSVVKYSLPTEEEVKKYLTKSAGKGKRL